MIEKGYYLLGNYFPDIYRPLKIRQKCGNVNSKNFYKLIHNILVENNNITSYFNSGVTKIVYNTKDKNKLFKMVIVKENINKALKEPLYMLNNKDICNEPINLTAYISTESKKNIIYNNNLNIIDMENIGSYCLITWFEQKAVATGKMIPETKEILKYANVFRDKTRKKIKNDGFCDLSLNNMGFFKSSPIYRWIDVRPIS